MKGWNITNNAGQVTAVSPDGKLTAVIYAPPYDKFDDASSNVDKEIAKLVDKAEADGPAQPWTISGDLKASNRKGVGVRSGAPVGWGSTVIDAPKEPLLMVWYFEPYDANRDANLGQVSLMLANIRKLANVKRDDNTKVVVVD
jgi:hypothetical protein